LVTPALACAHFLLRIFLNLSLRLHFKGQKAEKLERMGFTNLYLLKGDFLAWQGKEYPKVPKEVEEQSETSANL
jgi:hypothetical protein